MKSNVDKVDLINNVAAIDSQIEKLINERSELMRMLEDLIKKDSEDIFEDDSFWDNCSSSKIEKDKKRKMSNREFLDKLNEMDNLW